MDIKQITEMLLSAPGIEHGFIQRTIGTEKLRGPSHSTRYVSNDEWRVVLYWHDSKPDKPHFASETRGTLMDAVEAAFAAGKAEVPAELAWAIEESTQNADLNLAA